MKNQQYQYLCLVEELRKRLQDGELQSGSAIPSEAELAKALSLSKREVRPLLKNLEIAGILSGSRDGTYTLAKEMSDSMRELMHVMFLVQNISPFEVCQMRRSMELSAFPMAYARRDHLDLDELKNLLDEFRYGNGLDSIRADEEMHRWLIRASGNRLMECVTLDWTAPADADVISYSLLRDNGDGVFNTIARNLTSTSIVDNTALPKVNYTYKVVAYDNCGNRSEASATAQAQPAGNMSLWCSLPFNESPADVTANGFHARAAAFSYEDGHSGKGLRFRVSADAVQLPPTAAPAGQVFTVTSWVKMGSHTQAGYYLFDFGLDADHHVGLRMSDGPSGNMAVVACNGGEEKKLTAESSRIMCCTGWSRRRSMFPISTSFWIECRSSRSATIFSVRKAAHGIPCGRLFSHGGITFPWRTSWESTPTMRSCTASSCCASVTMNWWSSCGKENGTWKLPQQQESIGKLQASAA